MDNTGSVLSLILRVSGTRVFRIRVPSQCKVISNSYGCLYTNVLHYSRYLFCTSHNSLRLPPGTFQETPSIRNIRSRLPTLSPSAFPENLVPLCTIHLPCRIRFWDSSLLVSDTPQRLPHSTPIFSSVICNEGLRRNRRRNSEEGISKHYQKGR